MNTHVFFLSILTGILSAVMLLAMKRASASFDAQQILMVAFATSAAVYIARMLVQGTLPRFAAAPTGALVSLGIAALLCAVANVILISAMFSSKNQAYPFILSTGTSTLLQFFAAWMFFGGDFSIRRGAGLLIILSGAALLK